MRVGTFQKMILMKQKIYLRKQKLLSIKLFKQNIKNTNICEIGLRVHEEKNKVIIVSTIDNLIKGAGGQAVQAMNIMFGIDEKEGLSYLSMYIQQINQLQFDQKSSLIIKSKINHKNIWEEIKMKNKELEVATKHYGLFTKN